MWNEKIRRKDKCILVTGENVLLILVIMVLGNGYHIAIIAGFAFAHGAIWVVEELVNLITINILDALMVFVVNNLGFMVVFVFISGENIGGTPAIMK